MALAAEICRLELLLSLRRCLRLLRNLCFLDSFSFFFRDSAMSLFRSYSSTDLKKYHKKYLIWVKKIRKWYKIHSSYINARKSCFLFYFSNTKIHTSHTKIHSSYINARKSCFLLAKSCYLYEAIAAPKSWTMWSNVKVKYSGD